jgi:hypothetical protein
MTTPSDYEGPVDLNGTGISMFPARAEKMMTDIAKILSDTWDGWTAADNKIQSAEGKLGEGPMGKPMRGQYNPAAKQIREVVADAIKQLSILSEAGSKAPQMYVDADLQAGQYFSF